MSLHRIFEFQLSNIFHMPFQIQTQTTKTRLHKSETKLKNNHCRKKYGRKPLIKFIGCFEKKTVSKRYDD